MILRKIAEWLTRNTPHSTHAHQFSILPIEHAPVDDKGGHTTFIALICPCGAVDLYGAVNFDLTTAEFKKRFFEELQTQNMFVLKHRGDLR